jgi:hypothetical protein
MRGNYFRVIMLTLFLLPILMQAQKESPVKLGLRVAPNLSWINPGTEGYNSEGVRFGISAGLISDFYFAKNYAISTGFSFLFPSGRLTYEDMITVNGVQDTAANNRIYNFIYFEIPLMVKMQTNQFGDFSFFGQIGFGTGFRMKATAKNEVTFSDGTTGSSKNDINNKTALMRESVIAGIGIEYHIDKSTRITAGINYSNALNSVLKGKNGIPNEDGTLNDVKGLSNFLELSIGVLF